jgi:hypothetical protein
VIDWLSHESQTYHICQQPWCWKYPRFQSHYIHSLFCSRLLLLNQPLKWVGRFVSGLDSNGLNLKSYVCPISTRKKKQNTSTQWENEEIWLLQHPKDLNWLTWKNLLWVLLPSALPWQAYPVDRVWRGTSLSLASVPPAKTKEGM